MACIILVANWLFFTWFSLYWNSASACLKFHWISLSIQLQTNFCLRLYHLFHWSWKVQLLSITTSLPQKTFVCWVSRERILSPLKRTALCLLSNELLKFFRSRRKKNTSDTPVVSRLALKKFHCWMKYSYEDKMEIWNAVDLLRDWSICYQFHLHLFWLWCWAHFAPLRRCQCVCVTRDINDRNISEFR